MAQSVLIVEDEELVREFISDYFEKEVWSIYEAEDGQEALSIFEKQQIDIVILDVMLPKLDGWTVCRRLRKTSSVPIIMLTARNDEDDKLLGFEMGVDDYVTKPFSPRVLVAKAKALLKRSMGDVYMNDATRKFGLLELNERSRTVSVAGKQAELSPKEFDVLLYLIKQKDTVLTREQLLNAVWGYDFFGDARTVDTHIKKLRAKLGEESKRIVTVIRVGYKFEGM
ncbi:response regulator transcription factor [Bacillus massiliigorillae]|uniref:response regulator transcription factor n=1 Tax=Bacillus massiliigorillae TaxID=1243664 RepID=UPI0003A12980|nr:response regulator transcription factor [Bacillus massiliigorillae]